MITPINTNQLPFKTVEDEYAQPIKVEAKVDLQPASLDIHIGDTAKSLISTNFPEDEPRFQDIDLTEFSEQNPYKFAPNERLLVASKETFNIPYNIAAVCYLRSWAARKFIQHINAGFIDPGFTNSKLTMELVNLSYSNFPIYPGLSITQIVFHSLSDIPTAKYVEIGHYNNDLQVQESKK